MKNIPVAEGTKRKPLTNVLSKSNIKTHRIMDNSFATKKSVQCTDEPFELSVSEIVFTEIEIDQSYEIQLQIKNVTATSRRIKLIRPKDPRLEISESKQMALAPGLSFKLSVYFYAKEVCEIHSSLKILSDNDYQRQVPISVCPPAACLIFEPFIKFGYVRVGKAKTETIEIHNDGSVGTDVVFQCQTSEITVSPKKLFIESKTKGKISVTFNSPTIGPVSGFINVLPKQRVLSQIEFSATVMQFSKFLINEQGAHIEQIHTKPLLVGEKSKFNAFIINNTPKASNFRLSQKKGSQVNTSSNTTPEEVGREDTERILYYQPMQGRIEPYSETKVVFDIEGKMRSNFQNIFLNYATNTKEDNDESQLENRWQYLVTFHFDEDEKDQLKLSVGGVCLIPKVKLSTAVLQYGLVNVGESYCQSMTLTNFSDSAIMVNFPKSNNFKFQPQKQKVAPQSKMQVDVKFNPRKNGDLSEVYTIEVGSFRLPLKLFGQGRVHPNSSLNHSLDYSRTNLNSSLQLSTITKGPNQSVSRYFDISKMHISSICDRSILQTNRDETLKMIRQQRIDRHREEEILKMASKCKTYDDNKPMDYEFENRLNARLSDKTPQLDLTRDPLYIDKRQGKLPHTLIKYTNAVLPNSQNNVVFDAFKQTVQYLSTPKNQNEERLVNKQLLPEELRQVQVGPTSIQIDNIFINSQREVTFHIINNNKLPISIQMAYNEEQLAGSSKGVQILPANSAGGLRFTFSALSFGEFRIPVQYILNGKHFFEFSLVGTVILPSLNLNKNQIRFLLTQEDKEFSKTEKILLKNVYDYEAKFKWVTSKDGTFEVTPEEGTVQPHSQLPVMVKYHPNKSTKQFQLQSRNDDERLRLKVVDGNEVQLKCTSQVVESTCICKPAEINFKQISICKVTEQRFIVRNTGRSGTAIQIDAPAELTGIVQVTPQKKHLSADESTQVTVKVSSNKGGLIDSVLTISVRCGKSIQIPIKGNIILPKVSILEQDIDFGSTPKLGTPATKTITLANESNIWVDLQLNLGSPENILYRCLELTLKDTEDRLIITTTKPKDPKHTKPSVYHIRISPKSESKLKLLFVPEDVMTYNFELPLNISGYTEFVHELQRRVSCKGILNKLVVEPKEVDFKRVIIQSEKGLCKYQEIKLSNPTDEEIQWWTSDEDISPFSLEHTKGIIKPYDTEVVRISFHPSSRGEYTRQIGFFIDEPEMQLTHCYITIGVKACSDFPCIIFDRPYVLMPVVPLNTESRCIFEISNDGYENLNLKHIVVQELSNIDITLKYVNGANLSITKKKIKVEAVFKHDKPLSFTLNAEFYDENNRVYTLPISGTTDNCLYTTQDFFIGTVAVKESTTDDRTQPLSSLQNAETECMYLKRYLNSHVCFDKQISSFPESMLQNQMDLLFEVLCFYSTSFDKLKANRKCQNASAMYTLLDEIIRILKSEGALLNHMRPELLLGYNDCMSYFRSIDSAEKYYQIPWAENETEYSIQNAKAWVVLVYQILKIYNTYRMSSSKSKATAATKGTFEHALHSKLSTEERQLVAWIDGIYNTQESRFDSKPVEDFSGLWDCELLGCMMQKFTGLKVVEVYGKTGLSKKEIQKRCTKFVECLVNIGVSTHVQTEDIQRSRHREMMLLIEQLYQVLPNYLPKTPPIQFTCSLGQSVSKVIEISNPSKHTVSYWAKIEGSKDFQMQSEPAFVIESKRSIEYKVRYMSHFSNSSSATITFIGKKDTKSVPATMVFSLKGQTVGKISEKSVQVTCSLYEQVEFNINVMNNLGAEGEFKVQLFPDKNAKFPSFFCLVDKIKIKKTGSTSISVTFMPFVLEQQKCYIYFSDPNVGEFQYELTGIVEMPLVSSEILRIPTPIYVDTPASVEVSLPLKNDLLLRARKQVQSIAESKNSKIPKGQLLFPKLMPQQYTLELLPVTDMISCCKQIALGINEQDELHSSSSLKKQDNRRISMNVNMRMAVKEGVVLMVLRNASKTDIRRYKIIMNVINKPFRYVMEIRTNLFKQVVQPIPLINPTQQANTYTVNLIQDARSHFVMDCDKEIVVEPGKSGQLNLAFRPKTTGQFNAVLKMENVTICQAIEYELVGISEQPQSVQVNFKQDAKQSKTYDIKLHNPSNIAQRYTVKIELDDATGPNNICVPPFSSINYPLTVLPKNIRLYTGEVIFDDEGKYMTYRVTVDTRSTQPVREYNFACKERIPAHLEVEVEEGDWSVVISNSNMTGANSFLSKPTNNKYKLTYLSGRASETKIYLYFHSERKGDFSYLVNITVGQAPQMKLNPFKAELGKAQAQIIEVENIEDSKIKVNCRSSNPNTFSLEPSSFTIPPKSKFPVTVIYTPSNLELQSSDIIMEGETGERWRYSVSGIGILPTYDEQKVIQGVVNTDTSTFISFRNPFKEKIQVIISLETAAHENVFQLIVKNKRIEIEPLGLVSIPIVFMPKFNECYEAVLNVYMNERMSWKFVIVGLVQTISESMNKHFKFKCRQRKSQVVEFQLPELPSTMPKQFDEWTIKLKEVIPSVYTELVEKVVSLSPQSCSLIPGTKTLRFNVDLLAYKPFEAACIFELNQKNQCQWLSKIEMLCQPPEPDDEITIVSDINTSSSVSFKLTNRLKAFTRFNAYFTAESDIELAVSPKSGDLLPYGRQGTLFTLTFSPVQYPKTRSGKLIIETDESYWSYTVKGVLPHYSPPKGVSQVLSRLH